MRIRALRDGSTLRCIVACVAFGGAGGAACSPASAPAVVPCETASSTSARGNAAGSASATGAAKSGAPALLRSGMDPAVPPGVDFYAYANGGWLGDPEGPQQLGRQRAGRRAHRRTHRDARGRARRGCERVRIPDARRVADYFTTFMDEAAIEARDLAPLDKQLAAIASVKDKSSLSLSLGSTVRADVDVLNNTELHTDNALGLWVAQGLSGAQQFFLAFAQSWRQKVREAKARSRLVTDGHAPAEYRADTVRNLDAWYAAFDPKPGQALFLTPAERVRVW